MTTCKNIFTGIATILIFGILAGTLFDLLVPYATAHDKVTLIKHGIIE